MFAKLLPVFFLISLLSPAAGFAQAGQNPGVTAEMRAAANEFYQKQDWQQAARAYEAIVKLEEKNVNARYRYGVSLLGLNKNSEARAELEKAFAAAPNAIFAMKLAQAYTRLGEKEKAYETLEKSTQMGGIQPQTLADEKDFAAFKEEPRFKELLKKSDVAANPCKAGDEFRQFDFWVGEWDVKNPQGVVVGASSVQNILGQCVIFENWSTPVSSGKSFNIYDVNDKKWHQTWVSDKGTFTHYLGEFKDGQMILVADTIFGGKKTLARMTFSRLPNGDVRQFGENSTDDGKTWTTAFDLTYMRKK